MSSVPSASDRAGFGVLGYIFVGMTAAVMVLAVTVVLFEVRARAPMGGAPADLSASATQR